MKIGMLQQDYVVGDCWGNAQKIISGYKKLCEEGAELVVGSELGILGYPPKDLLELGQKIKMQIEALEWIKAQVGSAPLIVGVAEPNYSVGKPLLNNAVVIRYGEIIARRSKELLPTYDVFDEQRYFQPGPSTPCVFEHNGKRIGLLVCEDIWGGTENPHGYKLYASDPVQDLGYCKLDLLLVSNASPYYWGKGSVRFNLVSRIARRLSCPVVYVNQVGGNDELVFDGRSFVVNPEGRATSVLKPFEECERVVDCMRVDYVPEEEMILDDHQLMNDLYDALVCGVRGYCRKTGLMKAVIGESGGIDSALVTCIAVDALGSENVTAIGMPGPFSSAGSVVDARQLCANLGIKFEIVSIKKSYHAVGEALQGLIGWNNPLGVTEENVQARLRGIKLMAISNKTGAIVFSTGNKSELAVGYCTLYGDMCGGLAVISDVPKTLVYSLAHYVNRKREIIPQAIISKAPSAELRPDQKDQDSLPEYPVLDRILEMYIEERKSVAEIIATGLPEDSVRWTIDKVNRNEYKRQQAAPGIKVTTKAFGSGRRIPIAMKS